jgi:hypothetical protein
MCNVANTESHRLPTHTKGVRTTNQARLAVACIDCEMAELSKRTRPLRVAILNAERRMTAINRQRHALVQEFIAPVKKCKPKLEKDTRARLQRPLTEKELVTRLSQMTPEKVAQFAKTMGLTAEDF